MARFLQPLLDSSVTYLARTRHLPVFIPRLHADVDRACSTVKCSNVSPEERNRKSRHKDRGGKSAGLPPQSLCPLLPRQQYEERGDGGDGAAFAHADHVVGLVRELLLQDSLSDCSTRHERLPMVRRSIKRSYG